jgi:hypothetical protein
MIPLLTTQGQSVVKQRPLSPAYVLPFVQETSLTLQWLYPKLKNWADFQYRSGTLGDKMVYIGWDGLAEKKPCCTAEEWDSRLDEYRQGEYTGLYVRPLTDDDFRSDAG